MKVAVMLYAAGRDCYLERAYPEAVKEEIRKYYDLYPVPVSDETLDLHKNILSQASAVFCSWWVPVLDESTIARYFPRLEILYYAAGSVQYFARPFLARGVQVVSGWAANGTPVAEYAAAQIVLANKGFFQNPARMRENYDQARNYSDSCCGNYDAIVGILGAGAVGSQVVGFLKPYRLKIWVYDPYLSQARADALGVELHSLEEIFSCCDVISNHVAQLPATEGLIHYELLKTMKPYATLLNTGRGSQIVEADLIRAMTEVPTRSAVLDVTDPEPPTADSALWSVPNITLTTHIAGSMGREIGRIGAYIADEAKRFCTGEPLRYAVTLDALKTMA